MKLIKNILLAPIKGLRSLGKYLQEIFTNTEIRNKLLFTIFVIFIYRLLAAIPLPGIDMRAYQQLLGQSSTSEAGLLFAGFTGGALETPSIVGLGIGVYITASIIIQLLSSIIPYLEDLTKEGQSGRMKIDQYTRFLTLPLAFAYSLGYLFILSRPQSQAITVFNGELVALIPGTLEAGGPSLSSFMFMALVLTAGAMVIMWLAELITERGIGNGASIFITLGILSSLPATLTFDIESIINSNSLEAALHAAVPLIIVIIGFIILFAAIVFITESTRKLPIQYARRQRSGGVTESHLPLKLNQTGVMPIIFASALITFPTVIVPLISGLINNDNAIKTAFFNIISKGSPLAQASNSVALWILDWNTAIQSGTYSSSWIYSLMLFILICGFTIFYIFIAFKPADVAENLQKSGAFIAKPAIRPGQATEEYITKVLLRLSTAGAIFLGLIALIPIYAGQLVTSLTGESYLILSAVGGTSLLIVVSVALDTLRQINALRTSLNYEKYT